MDQSTEPIVGVTSLLVWAPNASKLEDLATAGLRDRLMAWTLSAHPEYDE